MRYLALLHHRLLLANFSSESKQLCKRDPSRSLEQNQIRQSTIDNLKSAFQSAEQALPGVSGMFVDEILSNLRGPSAQTSLHSENLHRNSASQSSS